METKIEHHFGNKVIKIEDIKEFQKQKKEQLNTPWPGLIYYTC